MRHRYKQGLFLLLAITTTFLMLLSFTSNNNSVPKTIPDELFESNLLQYNTVSKLGKYADLLYSEQKGSSFDTATYIISASNLVKKRFLYGISNYSFKENWIIVLLGNVCWEHIMAKVGPDEILEGYEGLCSQQTIVFMELAKRRGINVRTVGLGLPQGPGHFICEVKYGGKWHLFDVTKEPAWEKISNKHESLDYYLANKDSLFLVYEHKLKSSELEKIMTNVKYGVENEFPAKRMLLLHKISSVVMFGLPILFLYLFSRERKKSVRNLNITIDR